MEAQLDKTSTRSNKKSATTRIASSNESAYHEICERRYSLFQFSTSLTYAPFIHAKKSEVLPSPITLHSNGAFDNDDFDILEEVSNLTEIEESEYENDCIYIETPSSISSMRVHLKQLAHSDISVCREAEMALRSDKAFARLIRDYCADACHSGGKCNGNSMWKKAIRHSVVSNSTGISDTCSLSILNILETSANEFV